MKKDIIFLQPVFKEMIWGGNRLRTDFGYDISSEHTGECWAIAAHPHGDCIITSKPYEGMRLSELWNVSVLELPEATGEAIGASQHPGAIGHSNAARVLSEYIDSLWRK